MKKIHRLLSLKECRHSIFSLRWWRHDMDTFGALMAFYGANPPVTCGFSHKGRGMQSSDVLLFLAWINICTSIWYDRWFGTTWRDCDVKNMAWPNGGHYRYYITDIRIKWPPLCRRYFEMHRQRTGVTSFTNPSILIPPYKKVQWNWYNEMTRHVSIK